MGQVGGGEYPEETSWDIKDSGGVTIAEASSTDSGSFCGGDCIAPIYVTGMCMTSYNGRYDYVAVTTSGRWWYKNSGDHTLYWDATCDGAGKNPNMWIFDTS